MLGAGEVSEMPRNMSFQMTTEQYKAGTKTVTRRLGWWKLKIGEVMNGIEKGQGLKKGETVVRLGRHRIVGARLEPLNSITKEDCAREGFPDMEPREFIEMFVRHHGCEPTTTVNRIEFEHL
jgi:hypothetical protein